MSRMIFKSRTPLTLSRMIGSLLFGLGVVGVVTLLVFSPASNVEVLNIEKNEIATINPSLEDSSLSSESEVTERMFQSETVTESENKISTPDSVLRELVKTKLNEFEVFAKDSFEINGKMLDEVEKSFLNIRRDLTNYDIYEIQNIIEEVARDEFGATAADIFIDYYHYRESRDDLKQLFSSQGDLTVVKEYYETLAELRVLHFGPVMTQKLFSEQQAMEKYFVESMLIENDESSLKEEKAQLQLAMIQDLSQEDNHSAFVEGIVADQRTHDLSDRVTAYIQQKNEILNASLSEKDKEAQLERISHHYFSTDNDSFISDYINHSFGHPD